MRPGDEEIFLPFPAPATALGVAKEVRSTLLASSVESLRRRGLLERYKSLVSPVYRDTILNGVAGSWLPMDVGAAHYDACEALGFTMDEQVGIGAEVSEKIHGTFVGVVVKAAHQAGVTPWTLLPKGNQIYARLFRGGGGTRITKLGPKEVRAEIAGVPLLGIPYFRHAIRGIYQAGISLFCARCYVHEQAKLGTPASVALHIAWA
jgi:hypothetical protein